MFELEVYEISPQERERLLGAENRGIDPITNRGASAAREILAFVMGQPMGINLTQEELANYMRDQTSVFTDDSVPMSRFGITPNHLEIVDRLLA